MHLSPLTLHLGVARWDVGEVAFNGLLNLRDTLTVIVVIGHRSVFGTIEQRLLCALVAIEWDANVEL